MVTGNPPIKKPRYLCAAVFLGMMMWLEVSFELVGPSDFGGRVEGESEGDC